MHRHVFMGAAIIALAGCDSASEPTGSGGLALEIVSAGSGAVSVESYRVVLSGPTPRTIQANPGDEVTIDELLPGPYTITLQGFVDDEVAFFGRKTGVQVVAGQNTATTMTFTPFQPVVGPVTLTEDGESYTISFPAVAGADSYRIETDHDAGFPAPVTLKVTDPTGSLPIDIFGPLFLRARAFSPLNGVGVLSETRTVILARVGSTAGLDGAVAKNGNTTTTTAVVGDFDQTAGNGFSARQLYSFDLSGLPANATITSAVLRLFQASATPGVYDDLGNVIVDHLDYDGAIDGTDYADNTLQANIGTLSSDETLEHKALEVTASVQDDRMANRLQSQFRLLFEAESNSDGGDDFAQFGDQEQSCFYAPCTENDFPQLRLAYEE